MAEDAKELNAGAWLIHHDQKLSGVKSDEFENIMVAGRAARLLSYISKELEWTVSLDRVQVLARANGIKRHEVPGLLTELQTAGLIDQGTGGVAVLGVTQANLFKHANEVFEQQEPTSIERATLELADRASDKPLDEQEIGQELADTYHLSKAEHADLIDLSKKIGFVDNESVLDKTLLFNGSLFRRDAVAKAKIILDTLSADDRKMLNEIDDKLLRMGCLPEDIVKRIIGDKLWSKLHQIGYFHVSTVTNENGSTCFVSKPSALVKYVPGGLGDMHDDAKALASSLTYGILKSNRARGQIALPDRLMGTLIGRGYVEGWAPAIVQDYHVLERRGVVATSKSSDGYRLTLLKPEIGQMAQDLILKGDAAEATASAIVGDRALSFSGPEAARTAERLKDIPETKRQASKALDALRKTR